ncbi:hypothetical protein YC2023_014402 [Brassica napus]
MVNNLRLDKRQRYQLSATRLAKLRRCRSRKKPRCHLRGQYRDNPEGGITTQIGGGDSCNAGGGLYFLLRLHHVEDMLKQDSKRQSTSTPASFRRLEEQESRYSTEQGSDKLVTEDIETYAPERASPQDPRRIKLQNEDMRHTLKLAETRNRGPRRQPPNTALLQTKMRSSDNNPKESEHRKAGARLKLE